jgi:hypothetical protein
MKLNSCVLAVLATWQACAAPLSAQQATAPDNAPLNVDQLFATTCGWCHSDGGRVAGKGPQLMNSPRDLTHPDKRVRILDPDETEADLNWNVAVGMVRPDDSFRNAIDQALERLRADGTIDRIYQRYGVALRAPK